ncbi:MAG: excinuclease ABC subunit UvrC, partial [Candidatus Omnitrophota bacterium]|nr:excinuclease ABC subunit UvrC [Candidatus Omnitrophota bacterium]
HDRLVAVGLVDGANVLDDRREPLEPHLERRLAVIDHERHFARPHFHDHLRAEDVAGSEAEALLYEAGLIREKQPKYNVLFRDDKSYPTLKITVEEPFPRLFIGRGSGETGIKTIGPFAHAGLLHQAFKAVRGVIPFRTCRVMPKRACLDYHLGLCQAPCEGRITQADYQENLSKVFRLMEGKKEEVLDELRAKMKQASDQRHYEEAAKIRDQIDGLASLAVRPRQFVPERALSDLQAILQLPRLPRRIVGFDVSNIFGKEPVGSMVTFLDGKPFKDGYRRFKIKTVTGIDDFAMMREIVRRALEPKQAVPGTQKVPGTVVLPDFILIDGGRGHLNAALEVLKELQLELPAAGIAKEFEILFLPGRVDPVVLPPESRARRLAQRVRDEAHRFAIGYHRLLRGKDALTSALDRIPGIGPRRKQDLLVRFGSVEAIRGASVEELAQVRGISLGLAERISHQLKRKTT